MQVVSRFWPALMMAALAVTTLSAGADDRSSSLSVRLTSPLGRSGLPGPIRIVAQVNHNAGVLAPVRFYVDDRLLGTVEAPPYAVEWVDENPFERREIAVEVADSLGNSARDIVVLDPLEIVEATQVTSVLLEATVQDPHGRFVRGLGPSEFLLAENGVPHTLELVSQEEVPATFVLLIDSSGSMSRRIDFVQLAAARFAGYLRPQDRVMVAPFTRTMGSITGPTDDRQTITEAIQSIQAIGGTSILDSLVQSAALLENADGRRAIILVTDGYDEHSENTFDDALEAVRAAQTTVYVVGIGGVAGISLRGERLLKQLAAETGGRAFFPPREETLVDVHDTLMADVQTRYLIGYTPVNQKADGTWRAIELQTAEPEYVVRTRSGYLAPSPPPIRPSFEFTITSADGAYVDVTADELIVIEDGVEQAVETFHEAVAPVQIVLALDASGSMRRSAEAVVETAREFVAALRPEDSLAVILFADRSVFAHDLSTNREFTMQAIERYQAVGGTALYDALSDALIRLKRAEGRRVVVVMTDGRDEDNPGTGPGSVRSFDDVIRRQMEAGATIYPIGLGTSVDRELLERLASLSGGQAYFPQEVAQLREEYARIVEHLRRRYVVGYTSTNYERDGGWRSVEIRARSSDLVVASSGGYYAPER